MTKALAARLRELNEKATKGRWSDQPSMHGNEYRYVQFGDDDCYTTLEILPADAKLIVALHKNLPSILTALEGVEEMREALTECDAYFEERADAEYHPDRDAPVGNEEMKLLQITRAALKEKP